MPVRWARAADLQGMMTTYRGGIVHMEMSLLDTLTMVALRIGQAEEALF